MITVIEYLFLALLTLGTGLLSAYIVYKVVEPRAKQLISDYSNMVPARIKKELKSFVSEAAEGLDLGEVAGGSGGIGDIAGLLGGGGGGLGGLGELVKLFSQFSGQKTKKSGHSPGR